MSWSAYGGCTRLLARARAPVCFVRAFGRTENVATSGTNGVCVCVCVCVSSSPCRCMCVRAFGDIHNKPGASKEREKERERERERERECVCVCVCVCVCLHRS